MERGECRFSATVDLFGGFPGFAAHAGSLRGVNLRITDGYLIVDRVPSTRLWAAAELVRLHHAHARQPC